MAIEISLKKGTANPTSGLTLAEPLFNSTNNTFWMGKGTGNTPVWLGAGICGASGGIAAGLTYQIPTLGAVKDYFIGVSGSFLSSTTGFVSSFNGLTGAVTGVTTSVANIFGPLQTFNSGISASGATFGNGPVTIAGFTAWHAGNDGAGSGLDADLIKGVDGNRVLEELQSGLLYGGVLTINAGNTAAVDVSAGAGLIVTVNASSGAYPAPVLQTITWNAKTGVTLAGMTSSDFTFFRIDSSGNLQQSSSNFTQSQYLNSVVIGNVVHQSRAYVNRVHYHPIVAYASSAQHETFIRYFGGLKVDGYVMSGYGTTGGIQHTTGTAFALGANMDTDPNNPSLVTDSAAVPVQQLFYLYRNAGGAYTTDPVSRTTVNFANYDNGSGTLGNISNNDWSIQRVYKIPGFNNALYVYYGTASYSTDTVAANNILLETFAEADITRYNGVFLGWLIVRGGGSNVSSTDDCRIVPGGFFRNTTGGGGASTVLNLDDLGDVAVTTPANNEILRYDSTQGLWVNSAVTTLPLVSSFNGATGAISGVATFNGLTGAVQGVSAAVAGTGISVSGATGSVTITNIGVQSFNGSTGAVQGVSSASAGTGISISAATGAITITNTGVQSLTGTTNQITVSGSTGAVTLSLPNTITSNGTVLTIQSGNDIPASITLTGVLSGIPTTAVTGNLTVSSGFTASGVAQFASGVTFASTTDHVGTARFDGAVVLRSTFSGTTAAFSRVILANGGISAAGATLSGTVTAPTPALGNNSTLVATTAFVQNEIVADTVTTFNGRTGAVQGVSSASAGTGISVSGATGAITITNTGVQTFNGLTGAVTGASLGANTFTGLNSFNAGISSAGGTFSSLAQFTAGLTASSVYGGTVYTNNIVAQDVGSPVYINNNGAGQITYIGDYSGAGSSTLLTVDDSTNTITLGGPVVASSITNTGGLARNYTLDGDTRTQTSSTTANQTICSLDVGSTVAPVVFAVEVTIMASDTTVFNKHEIVRMLVTHDFTNTFNTQYGVTRTGTALATYTTTLTGAVDKTLRIRATPTSANLTSFVVMYRTYYG